MIDPKQLGNPNQSALAQRGARSAASPQAGPTPMGARAGAMQSMGAPQRPRQAPPGLGMAGVAAGFPQYVQAYGQRSLGTMQPMPQPMPQRPPQLNPQMGAQAASNAQAFGNRPQLNPQPEPPQRPPWLNPQPAPQMPPRPMPMQQGFAQQGMAPGARSLGGMRPVPRIR